MARSGCLSFGEGRADVGHFEGKAGLVDGLVDSRGDLSTNLTWSFKKGGVFEKFHGLGQIK